MYLVLIVSRRVTGSLLIVSARCSSFDLCSAASVSRLFFSWRSTASLSAVSFLPISVRVSSTALEKARRPSLSALSLSTYCSIPRKRARSVRKLAVKSSLALSCNESISCRRRGVSASTLSSIFFCFSISTFKRFFSVAEVAFLASPCNLLSSAFTRPRIAHNSDAFFRRLSAVRLAFSTSATNSRCFFRRAVNSGLRTLPSGSCTGGSTFLIALFMLSSLARSFCTEPELKKRVKFSGVARIVPSSSLNSLAPNKLNWSASSNFSNARLFAASSAFSTVSLAARFCSVSRGFSISNCLPPTSSSSFLYSGVLALFSLRSFSRRCTTSAFPISDCCVRGSLRRMSRRKVFSPLRASCSPLWYFLLICASWRSIGLMEPLITTSFPRCFCGATPIACDG